VNELTLLGGGGGQGGQGGGNFSRGNTASFGSSSPAPVDDFAGTGITDDDIPF